jgi:hypothetical protein
LTAFYPPFLRLSEKMPYLGPKHSSFCLRNVDKKSYHFFGATTYQKSTSSGCQKGNVPPSVSGFEGGNSPLLPHCQENFGHVTG